MSVFDFDALGSRSFIEAEQKGRILATHIHPDVIGVVDEAIEGWLSEHTSMKRDDPWTKAYVAVVRRQTLETLGALITTTPER